MGSLKAHPLFEEKNKFFVEPILLVVLDQVFKMIWKNDNLHSAHVGCAEFLGTHASEANFFPYLGDISFLRSFKGCLVLLQLDEDLSKLLIVSNMLIEDLCSFIELIIEASITTFL